MRLYQSQSLATFSIYYSREILVEAGKIRQLVKSKRARSAAWYGMKVELGSIKQKEKRT